MVWELGKESLKAEVWKSFQDEGNGKENVKP